MIKASCNVETVSYPNYKNKGDFDINGYNEHNNESRRFYKDYNDEKGGLHRF